MALAKDNAVTATPPKPTPPKLQSRPALTMQSTWMMAGLPALAFAVCCLRSFVPPHTPLLLWGDQLGFATKGVRVLGGELPYRDFFEFVTPGSELVYALLFRLLGVSLYVPNLLMALVAATAALWMTWCSKRLLRGIFVVLPAMLLIGFVLYGSMDATHHWFSTLAVMGAVAALFEGTSLRRVAVAGAMCGLAASFTQTKGAAVLLGLVAYLIWRSLHKRGAAMSSAMLAAMPAALHCGPRSLCSDQRAAPARGWRGTVGAGRDRLSVAVLRLSFEQSVGEVSGKSSHCTEEC